ncbi:MAG: LicD family protein [Clostridiales bacterium]|nr:LicD family protein [Clostridiales bacterium]
MSFKNVIDGRSIKSNTSYSNVMIELDQDTLVKVQKELLSMYKDVMMVCDKYGITPYLIGGSCLGAIRHKGFIPWDDDIDVGMTREDYNKFISVFNDELADKYEINAPNYSDKPKARFAKIYKKGTIFRGLTDIDSSSYCGFFLDIFIIENVPVNRLIRTLKGTLCNVLEFISSQVYTYETDCAVTREIRRHSNNSVKIRFLIGKIFSFRSAGKWFDSVDKHAGYKYTGMFGIVTGRKHYFGEIFDEGVFFPKSYADFCDIRVPVFSDTDTYLKNLYGNYMKLPPEDKRERHSVVEIKFEIE